MTICVLYFGDYNLKKAMNYTSKIGKIAPWETE